ncbi:threonine synthase [Kordiimonas sediminis]|uniref:Threonine synthase n=1 Tax=Kordiimonas sediminis TaxID=1735581 RepID=A0A919E919_9PROT|nr:threonine synthase [Kordiimonas sediminis]GHF30125.1 threonine synthase [Kordiimonas sediminis]
MKYISTRGQAEVLDFEGVTLTGLARDGGLYVPESIPTLTADEIRSMRGKSYSDIAFQVIKPFIGDCLTDAELKSMLDETYGTAFRHPAVAPLVQTGANDWILELFHGPTLAFKDFALQLLGRFFDVFSARRDRSLTILGATSGDTGSAAIEATRGRDNVKIFMLHPKDRVSDVQRRQMTTVIEPNVVNIAVEGTFDDCQALVKAAFNNHEFRDSVNLTAVNSINWARVMAQVVYYFTSAVSLGAPDRSVSYSVPTGNFGDIFAGYIARAMGLPIDKLVVATNSNDILAKTLQTGTYASGSVNATLSPSMDIQVSSNFERLVFDLTGRDGSKVQSYMDGFAAEGQFKLDAAELEKARALFLAHQVDDATTLSVMQDLYARTGYSADPHTAVGVKAAQECLASSTSPVITLATAHPVKFGAAVEKAIGHVPALPEHMADLMEREERMETLPNDLETLMSRVKAGS